MIASEHAAISAPPRPCTARAPTSISWPGAAPPASEASPNSISASDEHPALPEVVGGAAAEHQEARERDRVGVDDPLQFRRGEPRLDWIEGSATLTMLRSRMTMNWATQQTASSHAEPDRRLASRGGSAAAPARRCLDAHAARPARSFAWARDAGALAERPGSARPERLVG